MTEANTKGVERKVEKELPGTPGDHRCLLAGLGSADAGLVVGPRGVESAEVTILHPLSSRKGVYLPRRRRLGVQMCFSATKNYSSLCEGVRRANTDRSASRN